MSSYNFDKIEGNIYLGYIRTAENTQFLQQFKMNTILSLVNAPIDQSNRKEAIIYKQITFEDKQKEDFVSYFPECFHFIADRIMV
jgi:hypothetical protein